MWISCRLFIVCKYGHKTKGKKSCVSRVLLGFSVAKHGLGHSAWWWANLWGISSMAQWSCFKWWRSSTETVRFSSLKLLVISRSWESPFTGLVDGLLLKKSLEGKLDPFYYPPSPQLEVTPWLWFSPIPHLRICLLWRLTDTCILHRRFLSSQYPLSQVIVKIHFDVSSS